MKGKDALDAMLDGKVLTDGYTKIWADLNHKLGPFLQQYNDNNIQHPYRLTALSILWNLEWRVVTSEKYMTRWQVMTCVRNWERDGYYVLVKLDDDGCWMLPTFHSYDCEIDRYYYTRLDENRKPTGRALQFTL